MLVSKQHRLVLNLLSIQPAPLQPLIIFDVFNTSRTQSPVNHISEEDNGYEGNSKEEVQKGDVIVLEILVRLIFLEE